MSARILAATVALCGLAVSAQADEQVFPATLAGLVVLPAASFVDAPADAPADARISGKFTGPARAMTVGTLPGDTGGAHGKRPTGLSLPFEGQPMQGFSGYAATRAADGSFWMLTDNGFGTKGNSPDALLMMHRMAPDWASGRMQIVETVFLSDPDFVAPFRIAHEGTDSRYLTGADFDLESIQLVGEDLWIGDEFGPYLLQFGLDGRLKAVHPTLLDGVELKGPDTPGISALSAAGKDWRVQRSGGYEGMALQPETGLLWAMLEKPLLGEDGKPEGAFLRAMAFDPVRGEWTGQGFSFALAEGATAIGDMNFIDETRLMVIERDNGEGDPSLKCAGDPKPDCFPAPAMVKHVVLLDVAATDDQGHARRIGHIDLMGIADPKGLNTQATAASRDLTGLMTFPFFTIEGVVRVDDTHIMVGNDNNLPYSSGRQLDKAADNEAMLLSVPEFLSAR